MKKEIAEGSVFVRTEIRTVDGEEVTVEQHYARIRWTDETGKRRERRRRADSKTHAKQLRRELREDLERELNEPPRPEEKTFQEVAAWYLLEYLQEPRYIGDVKVSGLTSHRDLSGILRTLCAHFGPMPIHEITYDDLKKFKAERLRTPIVYARQARGKVVTSSRPRSVVSVHRELQLMRRIMNLARQQGWVTVNPFSKGDPLINTAGEVERMRVLSRDEERALLAECVGEREALRPAIICAIDTALRHNEQYTLVWSNVNLPGRSIELKARNAKTRKKRVVPISGRLMDELMAIYERESPHPNDLVFPSNNRSAFRTARRRAGLEDLHWHDLRHTAITWMLDSGIPDAKVMKISGHTSYRTFLKYVNLTAELTREAAEKMDARRERVERLTPAVTPVRSRKGLRTA